MSGLEFCHVLDKTLSINLLNIPCLDESECVIAQLAIAFGVCMFSDVVFTLHTVYLKHLGNPYEGPILILYACIPHGSLNIGRVSGLITAVEVLDSACRVRDDSVATEIRQRPKTLHGPTQKSPPWLQW